jgi:hypothetical protein
MTRKQKFVGVSLTPEARNALSRAALELTTPAGRRVSMSDVTVSALRIARQHEADLIADLAREEDMR